MAHDPSLRTGQEAASAQAQELQYMQKLKSEVSQCFVSLENHPDAPTRSLMILSRSSLDAIPSASPHIEDTA